jgi:hypothetical protein
MVASDAVTDDALELRGAMRDIFALKRPRMCGTIACMPEAGVTVVNGREGRAAHFHGVMTCNSVHACPVCSAKIRTEKRDKIERAMRIGARVASWFNGARWRMLTVTLRHDGSESLLSLRKGVMQAWRRMRQSGTIQRIWKKRVFASVRAIEVTHGENGWHPHLHIVVLTTDWTADELATLERAWCDAVLDELGEQAEPEPAIGLRWTAERANTAYYLSKLGLEMTHIAAKRARGIMSRNQWDIARDAVNGDERSIALWREYELAMKGVRAIEMDDRAAAMAKHAAGMLACDCCGELNEAYEKFCIGCEQELPDEREEKHDDPIELRVNLEAVDFQAIRRAERKDRRALRRVLEECERAGPISERIVIGRLDAYLASVSALYRAGEVIERWERREALRRVLEEKARSDLLWYELEAASA